MDEREQAPTDGIVDRCASGRGERRRRPGTPAAEELPTRAEQEDLLLALLVESEIGDGAVLDLGIGSGLVAEMVLEALPRAELVGVDFSRPMLDLARKRLSRFGSRVLLCAGDLAEPDAIDLPHRRYKAAFSIQTMHHLGDREKAAAFAWTAGLVDPGGLIAIVDRVSVEESLFEDWLVVWRRVDPTASGTFAQHIDELEKAATALRVSRINLPGCRPPASTPAACTCTATVRCW